MTQPIKLYSHAGGPNPWKVAIILEELGVPYENKILEFDVLKKPDFESIWINGRVPAIEDPNTSVTIGESGAIVEYLIATYDKENKLNFTESPQKWQALQWLHFQTSGQGPYFGQAVWFHKYHSEKNITSAQERYINEIARVTNVLDRHLEKSGEYLVGNKVSYADLSFVPWYWLVGFAIGQDKADKIFNDNPKVKQWLDKLNARPAVTTASKARQEAMSAGN